jgi:hypothetical protein
MWPAKLKIFTMWLFTEKRLLTHGIDCGIGKDLKMF